jgi:predicted O-linked N-acetylglucosamine transferase (SPINDLY family)
LWVGLPVLTLIGESFASRIASSLLNSIGLPELIAKTKEEYEAMAIELAMNPAKLADIRQKLANNYWTTALFNTPLFTRHLEMAYSKMMGID